MLIVAGRFEGVDERVIAGRGLTEVSVGDYVLSGGEIAAMALLDAVVRLLPGVMGNAAFGDQRELRRGAARISAIHPAAGLGGGRHPRGADLRRSRPDRRLAAGEAERLTAERRPDLAGGATGRRTKPAGLSASSAMLKVRLLPLDRHLAELLGLQAGGLAEQFVWSCWNSRQLRVMKPSSSVQNQPPDCWRCGGKPAAVDQEIDVGAAERRLSTSVWQSPPATLHQPCGRPAFGAVEVAEGDVGRPAAAGCRGEPGLGAARQ